MSHGRLNSSYSLALSDRQTAPLPGSTSSTFPTFPVIRHRCPYRANSFHNACLSFSWGCIKTFMRTECFVTADGCIGPIPTYVCFFSPLIPFPSVQFELPWHVNFQALGFIWSSQHFSELNEKLGDGVHLWHYVTQTNVEPQDYFVQPRWLQGRRDVTVLAERGKNPTHKGGF